VPRQPCHDLLPGIPLQANFLGCPCRSLANNKLQGPLVPAWSNLTYLEELDLSYNQLTGEAECPLTPGAAAAAAATPVGATPTPQAPCPFG
jgi:hypothetical protein